MLPKTKVSVVQYLNTAPLVWGMLRGAERDRYELGFTTPARCAADLGAKRVWAGIIPSIEYQRIDGLMVLPGISIASKRSVRSVLLLSRGPIEKVRTVALDTSSRSSVALVEILLRKFYSLKVETRPATPDPGSMPGEADAVLLIGDPALVYRGDAQVFDLAAEWRKFTGLPFVFAIWACHGGGASKTGENSLQRLRRDFESSREQGLAHLDEIAAEWAPRLGLTQEDVRIYLTSNIDYTLDEENLAGLRLFYRLAHEIGAIPAVKELEFA